MTMARVLSVLLLGTSGVVGTTTVHADAGKGVATIAAPCTAPGYRVLDYWLGDWDAFETDGSAPNSIARARITTIAQGCGIHELYEQTDGLIGDSILSYDPVRKHWQQTWVTNRGALMVLTGTVQADDVLMLEGESHLADGRVVRMRISWQRVEGGVREWASMSTDGGKAWAPAFDVTFRKRVARD